MKDMVTCQKSLTENQKEFAESIKSNNDNYIMH